MKTTPHEFVPPNPSGLCQCGCGETTTIAERTDRKQGRHAGRHVRYVRGHRARSQYGRADFSKPPYSVDENGCWVWNHARMAGKYGMIGREYAHRVYYRQHVGPIPEGKVIDHLCFNQLCVNPCHLEAVPNSENKSRELRRRMGQRQPQYPKCRIKHLD